MKYFKLYKAIMFISAVALLFVLGTGVSALAQSDLIITGVIDGPLTLGLPKAVELYVVKDIDDLSIYGLGTANNGGGSDGEEFTFPADFWEKGDFIYVATEAAGFNDFFGFDPDYTHSTAMLLNGDDAVELFKDGTVVDVFGEISYTPGTLLDWGYTDGWVYRVDNTGPDGSTFVLNNWTIIGPGALTGDSSNDTAASPFPIGTFGTKDTAKEVKTIELLGYYMKYKTLNFPSSLTYVAVYCSPGDTVTGGGFNTPGGVDVQGSGPIGGTAGWIVSATGDSGWITVYGMCAAIAR